MTLSLSAVRSRPVFSRPSLSVAQTLIMAFTVWSERRALARLPLSARKDIGISADVIARETARPLWDLPQNRLR